MVKTTKDQERLLNCLCKAFTFNGAGDKTTTISREQCEGATTVIRKLKRQIIENYPKDYTIHLRKATELSPKVNLSILRALLRRHQKHLHSERSYQWDKKLKKPMAIYRYHIL